MSEQYDFKNLEPDGLTFMLTHRKEVMVSYMKMVGSLGNHLDEKTRQLIILALQMTSPSPQTIKVIVPKALKAGATPDEILDAMILSVPSVGISTVLRILPDVLTALDEFAGDVVSTR